MIEIALSFQVLLWLIVLGVFFASGYASVFHPLGLYLAFHGLVFVIRPLLVHFFGFHAIWDYMVLQPSPEDFVRTLAAASLGLVFFATTCLFFGRARSVFASSSPPSLSPEQSRILVWMTAALLPLIAYSIYKAAGDTGGVLTPGGVLILTKSTGYVNDAQLLLGPLLCLWLLKTRFHWLNLVPILLYFGYRSWVGWSRWTILLFFITLMFQYCWYYRLRWLPLWVVGAAAPVLIIFNILGHNRDILKTYLSEGVIVREQFDRAPGQSVVEKRREQLDTQDFANFDYLSAVVTLVPERTGTYTYGLQYLQLFTEPIPRILWRGKPAGAPVSLFNLNQYANFIGLTFSLVGDGWASGGWLGVMILLGLAGAVSGWGHRSFWAKTNSAIPSLLYISFLGISPNWFRDGGISVFKFLLWTWLPLLLLPAMAWFFGQRRVPGATILIRPRESLRIVRADPNESPA